MIYQGKQYRYIKTFSSEGAKDQVAIEPVPNPDLETILIDRDVYEEIVKNQESIRNVSEENQKEISLVSEAYQQRIRKIAVEGKKNADEKTEKKRKKVSHASLTALPLARRKVAKNPLEVMQENWELVQWLDEVFGLEKLENMKSFPRRLAHRANAHFELEKPRSTSFYKGIVRYYSNYKRSIPVPMWWLRWEWFLEVG